MKSFKLVLALLLLAVIGIQAAESEERQYSNRETKAMFRVYRKYVEGCVLLPNVQLRELCSENTRIPIRAFKRHRDEILQGTADLTLIEYEMSQEFMNLIPKSYWEQLARENPEYEEELHDYIEEKYPEKHQYLSLKERAHKSAKLGPDALSLKERAHKSAELEPGALSLKERAHKSAERGSNIVKDGKHPPVSPFLNIKKHRPNVMHPDFHKKAIKQAHPKDAPKNDYKKEPEGLTDTISSVFGVTKEEVQGVVKSIRDNLPFIN